MGERLALLFMSLLNCGGIVGGIHPGVSGHSARRRRGRGIPIRLRFPWCFFREILKVFGCLWWHYYDWLCWRASEKRGSAYPWSHLLFGTAQNATYIPDFCSSFYGGDSDDFGRKQFVDADGHCDLLWHAYHDGIFIDRLAYCLLAMIPRLDGEAFGEWIYWKIVR